MSDKIYVLKATNNKCLFDTDDLDLADGNHTFVVKAKAEGFTDSSYSNEVVVTVESGFTFTIESDESGGNVRLYIDSIEQSSCEGTWKNVHTVGLITTDEETYHLSYDGNYDNYWHAATPTYSEFTLVEDVHIKKIWK